MAGIGNFGVFGDFGGEDEEVHKKSQSEGTSLRQNTRFELLTMKIGCSVWSVREPTKRKIKKSKKRHRTVIFHVCVGAQPLKIGRWYST